MRIDKLISDRIAVSRREAKQIISGSKVTVDGAKVTDPSFHVDPEKSEVLFDGRKLLPEICVYYAQ